MNFSHTRISKIVILALLCIVLFVLFNYGYRSASKEAVVYSSLQCVQSICIENEASGSMCSVREPRISEVIIETDAHNPSIKNVRIIPSGDRCQ